MRVCVDAAVLASGAVGIGGFATGLVAALQDLPDVELTVVDAASTGDALGGVGARLLWRERNLRGLLAERESDALLVVNPELPVRKLPVPSVVVVHDVFPLTAPALTRRGQRMRFRILLPRVCARATKVVCVSEATRAALHETVGVDPAKCVVIGEGPSPLPALPRSPDEDDPYLLYVGELFERKNIATLLAALPDVRLLLAGPADREAVDRLSAGDRVRHLGFVPPERLAELYAGAAALVLPSLEEGFGRTALDAMTLGVPVIASDIAALRELTASAAYLVDNPLEPERWRAAISTVLGDQAMRDELTTRGRERAEAFSWPAIAGQYGDLLRSLRASTRRSSGR